MKGIIFTELVEFVEEKFGFEIADAMIEGSMMPVKGAYTQAGSYSFEELVSILKALSNATGVEIETLIETYARHLFGRIARMYPTLLAGFDSPLPFIAKVDTFIHPEVKKLYPDAELPKFNMISIDDQRLVIDYISSKPLIPMAIGLMMGAADYFDKNITVETDKNSGIEGVQARFTVILNG